MLCTDMRIDGISDHCIDVAGLQPSCDIAKEGHCQWSFLPAVVSDGARMRPSGNLDLVLLAKHGHSCRKAPGAFQRT